MPKETMNETDVVTVNVGDLELPADATGLIAVLENLMLHAMTRKESEKLHDLLEQTRISIEETWAERDNGFSASRPH